MRNSYPGTCYRCGKRVEDGQGHYERFSRRHRKKHPDAPFNINWLTQHVECAIEFRGTAHSIWNKDQLLKEKLQRLKEKSRS